MKKYQLPLKALWLIPFFFPFTFIISQAQHGNGNKAVAGKIIDEAAEPVSETG